MLGTYWPYKYFDHRARKIYIRFCSISAILLHQIKNQNIEAKMKSGLWKPLAIYREKLEAFTDGAFWKAPPFGKKIVTGLLRGAGTLQALKWGRVLKIGMHLFCLLCDVKKTTPYVSFKITYDYLFSKVHQSEWLTPDTLKVFRRIPKWGPIMMRLSNPARLTSEGTYGNLWGIWFFKRTPICLSTITTEIYHDKFRYSKSTVSTSGLR